jgi:hypothetical protein
MADLSEKAITVPVFELFESIFMRAIDISASNRCHWHRPIVRTLQRKFGQFLSEIQEGTGRVFRRIQTAQNTRSIQSMAFNRIRWFEHPWALFRRDGDKIERIVVGFLALALMSMSGQNENLLSLKISQATSIYRFCSEDNDNFLRTAGRKSRIIASRKPHFNEM